MKRTHYRWQAPGNGKIFDAPLGEASYMNTRTLSVLRYIQSKVKVSQAIFDREIKEYLEKHSDYRANNSTPSHFFRPLLFLGFLKMSSSRVIELTLEGDKFLHFYEKEEYAKCKKYILNQLDNSIYPNIATKDIKLQLFPFRILFKLLLQEGERGLSREFIKEQLVYLKEYDDLALYLHTKSILKIAHHEEYDKFYTWVVNSLVNIEILEVKERHYFIAEDMLKNVEELYKNLPFESLFFNDTTLLCQLDFKTASERYKRDAKLIVAAKERDEYICQVDASHTTFLSKGKNYVEGHHVIPMFQQKNYSFELDDVANILSLCPNCHREIHSGDEREKILETIYNRQVAFMSANGVSKDELYKMYFCA